MLANVIADAYRSRMELYGRFPKESRLQIMDRIKNGILDYRNFLELVKSEDSLKFYSRLDSLYQNAINDLTEENVTE